MARATRKRRARSATLTVGQIRARFKSEWVLLADPQVDRKLNVIKGRVVCHSKDRDEVDRKAVELRLKDSAFLYTGTLPRDSAIIL